MPPAEAARVRALFTEPCAPYEPFLRSRNINRHKDGTLRDVQSSGMPILDVDGRLLGYRGLDRDVTALKQAQAAQRKSEERFRRLFDDAPLPMGLAGPEGAFLP